MSALDQAGEGLRTGFVTLVGRPNTGKSTLVNALVGQKVAAVTPHPQTTRTHLLGVVHVAAKPGQPAGQIVLVDTPGVHRGRGPMSRSMLRSVRAGLEGRDLSLLMVDVTRPFGEEDAMALDLVRGQGAAPAFLLLNKMDKLERPDALLPLAAAWRERHTFAEVVPISALKRENLDTLVQLVLAYLPTGPAFFPPEQSTDQPEHFLITEIIREQAMLQTQAEVPHTLAVRIEGDRRREGGKPLRVLQAAIYCERPGQKAILIGKRGEMIRKIGTAARQQLEARLGGAVYLELHVLVRENWRENPRFVAGLDFHRET